MFLYLLTVLQCHVSHCIILSLTFVPLTFLNSVCSYFASKSSCRNAFTSSSFFSIHPVLDSTLAEVITCPPFTVPLTTVRRMRMRIGQVHTTMSGPRITLKKRGTQREGSLKLTYVPNIFRCISKPCSSCD